MIINAKTPEGDVVGLQSAHVLFVQEVGPSKVEVTMINNKRFLVEAKYIDVVQQLNRSR